MEEITTMCGRFTLTRPVDEITRHFGTEAVQGASGQARYNIAPTQNIYAVRGNGRRTLSELRWGLIPGWSRDGKMKSLLINARAETLTEKPAFRECVATRRCLIPADGFYEWTHAPGGGKKQPWHIGLQDSSLFAFAGLWDRWQGIESCTIITTRANEAVAKLHDRMPVIVPSAGYDAWLEAAVREALALLQAYPAEEMRMYPVSGLVSGTKNDEPACREPLRVSQAAPPLRF
ncbi:MAG TPA: SOS response-associated peptidase [Terriglobales bacterium]